MRADKPKHKGSSCFLLMKSPSDPSRGGMGGRVGQNENERDWKSAARFSEEGIVHQAYGG